MGTLVRRLRELGRRILGERRMKAKDIAELLMKHPDRDITVWDAFHDCPCADVYVTLEEDGTIMVSSIDPFFEEKRVR
jgi:hypothetical protein